MIIVRQTQVNIIISNLGSLDGTVLSAVINMTELGMLFLGWNIQRIFYRQLRLVSCTANKSNYVWKTVSVFNTDPV